MLYLDFLSGQFGPWLLDVCLSTPEEETSGQDISYKAPEKRRGSLVNKDNTCRSSSAMKKDGALAFGCM